MFAGIPQDFVNYVKSLERRINEQTRQKLTSVVIPDGAFTVLHPNGQWLFHIGSNAQGKRFVSFHRDDGTAALEFGSTTAGEQFVGVWDRSGNVVLSDDAVTGDGLARPWLPLPAVRARYSDWPACTSDAFERVWNLSGYRQHPNCLLAVRHTTTTDAATTGEVRVVIGGTTIQTIPVGFAVATTVVGPFAVPGEFGDGMTVGIEARRTAGTGEVRCDLAYAWTLQS